LWMLCFLVCHICLRVTMIWFCLVQDIRILYALHVTSHEVNISFYHIFVRKTYLFACVINEEVPDP
jgi:hypothetical protein